MDQNKSTETDPGMTQMLELGVNNITTVII